MKVTIDIDCTPEEARHFMGLPDLGPLHAAYLDKMRAAIEQGGVTPDMMRSMIENWAPMGEAGFAMWRQFMDHMGGSTR